MNRAGMRRTARALEIVAAVSFFCAAFCEVAGGFSLAGITVHGTRNPGRLFAAALAARLLIALPGWTRAAARWIAGNRRDAGLALLLFALSAVPRLWNLSGSSLNSDEFLWMDRGQVMIEAMKEGRFVRATAPLRHPGVIPAFLVGVSQDALGRRDGSGLTRTMDPVAAARLPLALLGSIAAPCIFLLGRRLWSPREAFFGAIFLALEPSHIALSRVAHLDATLTLFAMAAMLAYAAAETGGGWRCKAASGILFGCALLTKSPALVVPALLAAWRAGVWAREGGRVRPLAGPDDAAAALMGFGLYLLLFTRLWMPPEAQPWFVSARGSVPYHALHGATLFLQRVPAAEAAAALYLALRWIACRRTGREMRGLRWLVPQTRPAQWLAIAVLAAVALRIVPHALENSVIRVGRIIVFGTTGESDPGIVRGSKSVTPGFYPFLLSVRLVELLVPAAVLGAAVCAWRFLRDRRTAPAALLPLAGAGFIVSMMFGRRVAMRYVLPAIPFLCVMGGIGLSALAGVVEGALRRRVPSMSRGFAGVAGSLLIAAAHAPALTLYAPDYYLFHNMFIGGATGAARSILVGWGEGYREAVRALKGLVAGREVNITVAGDTGVFDYYWNNDEPRVATRANINSRAFEEADYVVAILNQVQRNPGNTVVAFAREHKPLRVVNLHGLDIAGIYAHQHRPVRSKTGFKATFKGLDHETGLRGEDPLFPDRRVLAALVDRDGRGWLVRGPYRSFVPGDYVACFRVRSVAAPPPGTLGLLEVSGSDGATVLAAKTLTAADFPRGAQYENIALPFRTDGSLPLEFRVFFADAADLFFYSVKVYPAAEYAREGG